jgi:hypothetical protein
MATDFQAFTLLNRDIDETLLELRGLVLVRDLLRERGASRGEIESFTDTIDRLRVRLADMIRGPWNPSGGQTLEDELRPKGDRVGARPRPRALDGGAPAAAVV